MFLKKRGHIMGNNLEQEIEDLRSKLYNCVAKNGIKSPLVLQLSMLLDQKIVAYLKAKRGFTLSSNLEI